MAGERWQFTQEDIENTPSRKAGIDFDKELNYRQQAANFLQDMGQRLQVPQLVINTAIVYMHRFYMFHSFTKFHRNSMVAACLFLAAKVEEQPRKLEHVLKVAHMCLHRDQKPLDTTSEMYLEQAQELVINENILLQTLGFDITVDHPHSHVVKTCTLVKATKDLAQTSYFLATNSLHLTNLCLQVNAKVVASVCIHLACKWANWEIPRSSEGKDWYQYVDGSITPDLLEDLTAQFVQILDKCPSKLKKKLMSHRSDDVNAQPPEKKQKTESSAASAAAGSERSGQSSQPGSSTAASHTYTNHERKDRGAQESSSKWPNPPSASQSSSRSKPSSSQTSGANAPESNPGLRRVKTESAALSTKEYMERKQRELNRMAPSDEKRHSASKNTSDSKRHSSSAVKPEDRERHHGSQRPSEALRNQSQEQHTDSLSQQSTDDKISDKIDDVIERSMKEQPPLPPLTVSDSSKTQPMTNSNFGEPSVSSKSRSDKRSQDSSRRSHEAKTRHNVEAKHHSKNREERVNSPALPHPAEPSHSKRERKNSSRSSKSPHKKEARLQLQPEVTASPHSEIKLKIKLGNPGSSSSHKKEKEEKKSKTRSPMPPEKDSRTGSDSEKTELKIKLNLKNVKSSAAGSESSAQQAEADRGVPAIPKLVFSKDKVSGHYSSGHHHKHRHSSSHNSGDKRKRSHSPASAEGHSGRHSHKQSRTSSSSGNQSGNGHHHGNSVPNANTMNALLQNLDHLIKHRSGEIQKQQQQMNHNPPLPSDNPDMPPLPSNEPPPQPPLPPY